jgi:PAS domain S-box-containing protein
LATTETIGASGSPVRLEELRHALAVLRPVGHDAILLHDMAARVLEVNDGALELYGVTRERLLEEGLAAIVLPERLPRFAEVVGQVRQAGKAVFSTTHLGAGGRRIPVEVAAHLLELDEGPHVLAIVRDVGFREDADRARRESEERYRQVVQNAPLVQFAIDRDGLFTLSEGQGLAQLGLKPGQVVGLSVRQVYAAVPEIIRDFEAALTGQSFRTVNALGPIVFETGWAPLRDEAGAVVGVTGVAFDVTARVRAEEARQQTEARLTVAERLASAGRLAAGVAHEINNPLACVLSNLETALVRLEGKGKGVDPEVLAELRDAREGAVRVRDIVRDLRVFSRGGEETGSCDAAEVARSALTLAANELRHRALVVTDFQPAPRVALAERRLAQVLVNLLVNAAHAIEEGRVQANQVRVAVRPREASVLVEVADTGAGMPPEVRERIFEPFFSTKAVGEGMGLGLALCHSMVSDAGGVIEVESAPGQGSTFRVLLPAAPPAETAPAPAAAATEPLHRRLRLLVVDDEPMVARAAARSLAPHQVEVATDGQAALARLLGGERYDVIFCDLMMPSCSGMEVHARLSREVPEQAARLVFLTGGAFTAGAREFLERSAVPVVEKPFDPAALRQVAARVAAAGDRARG